MYPCNSRLTLQTRYGLQNGLFFVFLLLFVVGCGCNTNPTKGSGGSGSPSNLPENNNVGTLPINTKNGDGDTPLHVAIKGKNDVEIARLVGAPGIDLAIQDADGNTPLNLAAEGGDEETVKKLLAKLANPNVPDHEGNTPLHKLADKAQDPATIKALLDYGASVYAKNTSGETPLHRAIDIDKPEMVWLMLALILKDIKAGKVLVQYLKDVRCRFPQADPTVLGYVRFCKNNSGGDWIARYTELEQVWNS